MAEPTLVVREGDLDAMEEAMLAARDTLRQVVDDARDQAERIITGWDPQSESRQAQQAFDRQLADRHTELLAGLERVRSTLADVRELSRQAEIRCVAIMD